MIRVSVGFLAGNTITKVSSRLGLPEAPFASLRSSTAKDSAPGRDESTPRKRKRKK